VKNPSVIRNILGCLGLPARAPPVLAPTLPPDDDAVDHDDVWDADQTSPYEDP